MLVKIEIYHDGKSWCGRGIGVSLFTQGRTYEKLLANVREAAHLHFEETIETGEAINLLVSEEATHRRAGAQSENRSRFR